MTTVALKDGIISADGFVCCGTTVIERRAKKLYLLTDGSVVAYAGSCDLGTHFLDWIKSGEEGVRPPLKSDSDDDASSRVLKVYTKSDLIWVKEYSHLGHREYPAAEPLAWGSGAVAALSAMYSGKDSIGALEIASLVDPFTGGDIMSFRVK